MPAQKNSEQLKSDREHATHMLRDAMWGMIRESWMEAPSDGWEALVDTARGMSLLDAEVKRVVEMEEADELLLDLWLQSENMESMWPFGWWVSRALGGWYLTEPETLRLFRRLVSLDVPPTLDPRD